VKPYGLALILIAGVGAAMAWRSGSVPVRSVPDAGPPVETAPPRRALPSPAASLRLSRNPFEYAETVTAPSRSFPAQKVPPTSPGPVESATPLPRLVGFLHKGGALKAILSVRGDVFVLAVGEEGGGYAVTAADEERGARLRGPDGSEFDLPLPGQSGS